MLDDHLFAGQRSDGLMEIQAVRIWQEKGCPGPVRDMLDVYGRPALPAEKVQQPAGLLRGQERGFSSILRRKIIVSGCRSVVELIHEAPPLAHFKL